MKNKYIRQMLIIPVIIWMAVVFKFSNEPAEVSDNTSSRVTRIIVQIITSEQTSENEKQELIEKIDPIVRKIAHFTLYAIGGFLIMIYINIYNMDDVKKILYSVLLGTIYASSDEIHQIFIPGRSGQLTDVIIDTMGVATGACLCLIIIQLSTNIANKNKK